MRLLSQRADLTERSLALNEGRLIVYGECAALAGRVWKVQSFCGSVPCVLLGCVTANVRVEFRSPSTLTVSVSRRKTGILGRANARNRNGRVYPKHLLQREATVFYNAHVRMGRALGEMDHPPASSPTFRSLNLNNVSHQVLDYHWEGDDLMGFVEVLPTETGGMLRDLYRAGYMLGMSSRGWATLKDNNGFIFIQEDFELITFDFVSDPSTEGAYLRPVQRKYEGLKPLIDIKAKYRSFMNYTQTAKELEKQQKVGTQVLRPTQARTGPATAPALPPMATGGQGYGSGVDYSVRTLIACEDRGQKREGKVAPGSARGAGEMLKQISLNHDEAAQSFSPRARSSSGAKKGDGGKVGVLSSVAGGDGGGKVHSSVVGSSGGNSSTVFGRSSSSARVSTNKVMPLPRSSQSSLRDNWMKLKDSGVVVN